MSDIILHHFDISPFAEKIRLVFGLKSLAWKSVQIPLIMPKPDLTLLTGGYRKTPVMQIGADIFCDTRCIAQELERRCAEPSLFPNGSRALTMALGHWADTDFFQPGAGLSMGTNEGLPEDLLEDRRQFFAFMDFGELAEQIPNLYLQFKTHLYLIEDQLSDGRSYLLGDAISWADILAYFPVWMSRSNIAGAADMLKPLYKLTEWEQRMQAVGHGHRQELSADEAIAIAAASEPAADTWHDDSFAQEFEPGLQVSVTPGDYGKDSVVGELIAINNKTISIRRQVERVGELAVHFPTTGYSLEVSK